MRMNTDDFKKFQERVETVVNDQMRVPQELVADSGSSPKADDPISTEDSTQWRTQWLVLPDQTFTAIGKQKKVSLPASIEPIIKTEDLFFVRKE
jgi:hypothetical protein